MQYPVRTLCLGLLVGLYGSSLPLFAAEKAVMKEHVSATRPVAFEVYIPVQHREQLEKDLDAMHDPGSPTYQKWVTPAEFHARYGASQQQIDEIKEELTSKGFAATVVNGHRLHVTGQAAAVEQVFATRLESGMDKNGKTVVAATRAMTSPDAMARVGAVVVGLANKMPMQTHSHKADLPANRYSATGGYWFTDLKQAYSFPSYLSLTGTGVTIATMVDGAYAPEDMTLYFTHEKLKTPKFSEVDVDGGAPFDGDSFETDLDFQQAGGMAPGAKFVHYNIPDLTDNSIIDGLSQIDTDNIADIVSMSFGGPEIFYTAEYNDGIDFTYLIAIEDDLLAQGNAQGITFIASSGDTGALTAPPLVCFTGADNCGIMRASVEFPASSPHVTGVGGTDLITTYDGTTKNSAYVREQAFGDPLGEDLDYGTYSSGNYWGSGGGDSILFKKPKAQTLIETGNKTYRTVPDIAGHMGGCPGGGEPTCNPDDSYDLEYYGGHLYGVIGTSAAAPDFAGLVALGEQRAGGIRVGNVNYALYLVAHVQNAGGSLKVFNKHIPGFNGYYFGSANFYDRVTGLGTLNGVDALFIPNGPKAGIPQTPSNP